MNVVILLALVPGTLQDAPPAEYEPSRHHWLKWKPGTYVVIRQSATSGGRLLGERHVTARLEKVHETGYELLETVHENGGVVKTTSKVTRPRRLGEEIIEGKLGKRAATLWESQLGEKERGEELRLWLGAAYVPLRWKSVVRGAGSEDIHMELFAAALHEELNMGAAKVKCVRLEGTAGPLAEPGKAAVWWSDEVPGGVVRTEITNGSPPDGFRFTFEAVKFGESRLEDPPPVPPGAAQEKKK